MACSWCKTDEHIVVTKGWGRMLGGLARSPFGIMLEIPQDIEIPVCKQCHHRIVNDELMTKLAAFEQQEIAAEKARRGTASAGGRASADAANDLASAQELKHLEKSNVDAEWAEWASQLRYSLAEIETLWLDGNINRAEAISFIIAWVRREVDPAWLCVSGAQEILLAGVTAVPKGITAIAPSPGAGHIVPKDKF